MKLSINDPLLGNTPELEYASYWPSEDSLLDSKVRAMLDSKMGKASALQSVAKTGWNALRIIFRNKATVVGDLLENQLDVVSSFTASKGGQALQGIFAAVEWGSVKDDPLQAVKALATSGVVPVVMATISGVPLVGPLANAYVQGGMKLAEMFVAAQETKPVLMPWSRYARGSDEEVTRGIVLDIYSKSVDQTNLYRPPWNPKTPWQLGHRSKDYPTDRVWAPWDGDDIPWIGDHVGLLPGTQRIFGQIQLSARDAPDPRLSRYLRTPTGHTSPDDGASRKDTQIWWPNEKTNCGEYYPAAASTCTALWAMSAKAGSPDMYKVHVQVLLDEWKTAFETLNGSFAERYSAPGPYHPGLERRQLGEAMVPWIAYRLDKHSGGPWELGPPWDVPSFGGWVTPEIYEGKVGDPYHKSESIWIEEDLARNPKVPGWPYGAAPKQHPCSMHNKCSSDLAATGGIDGVIHPASWKTKDGPPPPGYRKIPYPTPEMTWAQYASPYTAIVRPALLKLRQQQEAALKATLICAYVRPVDLPGLPMYGAFQDKALQQLCLDLREVLLKSTARFRANLKDVQAIDPEFASRLKASGVTGTPGDFGKALGRAAGPIADAPEPPPGNALQGGAPFFCATATCRPRPKRASGIGIAARLAISAGLAATGCTAVYFATRGKKR